MHSLVVKETAEATTQTDVVPEPEVAKPEVESKTEELKTGFNAGRFCRTIFFSGLAIVTLLAFFTFFGGVEFHGQVPEQPLRPETYLNFKSLILSPSQKNEGPSFQVVVTFFLVNN